MAVRFLVAIGQVDHYLAIEIKKLLVRGLDEKWEPETDVMMDKELHQKYSSELYESFVP